MTSPSIHPLGPKHEPAAEALLGVLLAGRRQMRLGEEHDVLAAPGLGAWDGPRLVGIATWTRPERGGRSELAVLAVDPDHRGFGVGGDLVEAAAAAARAAGAGVMWLVTTNDNLEALRLYQRHGFRLTELRAGAVDGARRTKPSIPITGRHGIPLRDELVLERVL